MIVFYNPHVDDFLAEPPHFRYLGRKSLKKYGHLLQGTLQKDGHVKIYVDATSSAFVPQRYFHGLPAVLRRAIANRELARWIKINGLTGKVRRVDAAAVNERAVLYGFSYKAATGKFKLREKGLNSFPKKVLHLSHYFASTQEKANNLKALDGLWLAGDVDISSNEYFRRFFPWYQKLFLVTPFAVAERFRSHKSFDERLPKAVATGSFHNLHEEVPARAYVDHINFFGHSTYHPVRKLIYDQSGAVSNYIDSQISPYRPSVKKGRLQKIIAHYRVAQKGYFSIDIVELYNNYRYAIVGEEASGFPALGSFEAMACGCVLIAQPQFYQGLGMEAGIHYVSHDGTLPSIQAAIEALNQDPQKAERIAVAGRELVERLFGYQGAFDVSYRSLSSLDDAISAESRLPV